MGTFAGGVIVELSRSFLGSGEVAAVSGALYVAWVLFYVGLFLLEPVFLARPGKLDKHPHIQVIENLAGPVCAGGVCCFPQSLGVLRVCLGLWTLDALLHPQ
jgi:hypothetical protein